jgi:hypothetical protein
MTHTIQRMQGSNWNPSLNSRGSGLIMSATLNPPVAAVARANPADRLGDYLDALKHYLSLPSSVINRILFVDNSNSDLSTIAELICHFPHDKDVELISFEGNDHPHQRGKAYGEFRLMDFGLENSTLFELDDIVWKTTGRLKFLNLPEMVEKCNKLDFDIFCDLHNVPWVGSGKWSGHESMDLRVFAFRMRAYNAVFRALWCAHEEGFDAELLYHHMLKTHQGTRICPRFPIQAQLQGISGRHLRDYRSNSQRLKDAVRASVRQVAPWLWL